MALEPLATVDDVTVRGVTVASEETARLSVFLEAASAAVRDVAGCPISRVADDVVVLEGRGQYLPLPGPPVVSVASVECGGVPVTDWELRSGALWRPGGWSGNVTVTYTHGLETVPADIVDLVCRMAVHALVASRAQPDGSGLVAAPVSQEVISEVSVSYANSSAIRADSIPRQVRARLAARFGGTASVVVSR